MRVRKVSGLGALALAAGLGGCAAVGPDFSPPQAAAAQDKGYAMAGDPAPGAPAQAAVGQGAWWSSFGSAKLDEVVRLALSSSPSIAEADATLQRARAQLAYGEATRLPQADASASTSRERINTQRFGFFNFPSPTINFYTVGASVSYDLDLFGGRRRSIERDEARLQAARMRLEAAHLSLASAVAGQAVRIAAIRAELDAARAVVVDDQRLLEDARRAEREGAIAPSTVSIADSMLAQDEAAIPRLERDLAIARHQLALLVGRTPAQWEAPDFTLEDFRTPPAAPLSLPSELVRARPDIRTAEAELHAAVAEVGVAVADQYPNLRLSASFAQQTRHPEDIFRYKASQWSLMSGLTAPLFHGGALKANRRAAEAAAEEAMARYQQTVLRAFVQVSDVLASLGAGEREIEALGAAESAALIQFNEAMTRYRLGAGPVGDVIVANKALTRARSATALAKGRRLQNLIELHAATATDWRGGEGA